MRQAFGFVIAGVLLAVWPAARAGDDPPKKEKDPPKADQPAAGSPKEQFEALRKEFAAKQQEIFQDYRKAKEGEERQAVLKRLEGLNSYPQKVLELAKAHAEAEFAFDALVFVMTNRGPEAARGEARDLLMKRFADDKRIGSVCESLLYQPDGEKFVKDRAEKSPHAEVRALAQLALVRRDARDATTDEQLKTIEKALEEFVAKYKDVPYGRSTVGAIAERELKSVRARAKLAVGKPVPELEGPDLDGKTFKLSDYRGKVVLLDFWAHW
jgi:hypothetical protein